MKAGLDAKLKKRADNDAKGAEGMCAAASGSGLNRVRQGSAASRTAKANRIRRSHTECGLVNASGSLAPAPSFKGNKQLLPSKICVACGRPMAWRKRWARTWAEVKLCSQACRKGRTRAAML